MTVSSPYRVKFSEGSGSLTSSLPSLSPAVSRKNYVSEQLFSGSSAQLLTEDSRDWQANHCRGQESPNHGDDNGIAQQQDRPNVQYNTPSGEDAFRSAITLVPARRGVIDGLIARALKLIGEGKISEARAFLRVAGRITADQDLGNLFRILAPPRLIATGAKSASDLSANVRWIKENGDGFAGKWVALQNGNLIDSDESRAELQRRLVQRHYDPPLFLAKL